MMNVEDRAARLVTEHGAGIANASALEFAICALVYEAKADAYRMSSAVCYRSGTNPIFVAMAKEFDELAAIDWDKMRAAETKVRP